MSKGKGKGHLLKDLNRTLELSKELIEAGTSLMDRFQPAKPLHGGSFLSESAPPKLTPYEVMGLPKDATENQLRARYRELAKLYHADKGSGSDAMMKRVNRAMEEIKKEKKWR